MSAVSRSVPASRFVAVLWIAVALPTSAAAGQPEWWSAFGAGATWPTGSGPAVGLAVGPTLAASVGPHLGAVELAARMTVTRYRRDDDGVMLKSGLAARPVRLLTMSGGQMMTYSAAFDCRYLPSQKRDAATMQPFVVGAVAATFEHLDPVDITYQYAGHTWPEHVDGDEGIYLTFGIGGGTRIDVSRDWAVVLEARYEQTVRNGPDLHSVPLQCALQVKI